MLITLVCVYVNVCEKEDRRESGDLRHSVLITKPIVIKILWNSWSNCKDFLIFSNSFLSLTYSKNLENLKNR